MNETIRTKFELTEQELVNLFEEKIKRFGSSRSGTYNVADPTHWEKTEVTFYLDNPENQEPNPIDTLLHDCTWLLTITFSEDGKELASAAWDPSDKIWRNITAPAFFNLLHDVFMHGQHDVFMHGQHESEMGSQDELGDYHGRNE